MFYLLISDGVFVFHEFQAATRPRAALPAPVPQTPLPVQATYGPAPSTASAPNCQVRGFVRAGASLLVASPSPLWLAHLHPPPNRRLLSAHPLPFSVDTLLPFPNRPRASQPRYIPRPQSCVILSAQRAPSRLAHPS